MNLHFNALLNYENLLTKVNAYDIMKTKTEGWNRNMPITNNKYIKSFHNVCKNTSNILDVIDGIKEIDSQIFMEIVAYNLMTSSNDDKQEIVDAYHYVCSFIDTEEKRAIIRATWPEKLLFFEVAYDFMGEKETYGIYPVEDYKPVFDDFALTTICEYSADELLLQDNNEQLYFGITEPMDNLLIVKISNEQRVDMEKNQLSLRDLFLQAHEEDVMLLDLITGVAAIAILSDRILPQEGKYLNWIKKV